jgi:hypothetical protein
MSARFRLAWAVAFFILAVGAGVGCSHEPIGSGAQGLAVTVRPAPSGIGRYESASMIINRIVIAPTDPNTAALYGTAGLTLKFTPFTADLATTQDLVYTNIALGTGTYRVKTIEITPLVLVDQNLPPVPASCLEGIAVIDGQRPSGIPASFTFTDPPSLAFTVQPGQTTIPLNVDIPGLIQGYESSYTCTPGCGPGGTPCLTAFNANTFRAAFLANASFD